MPAFVLCAVVETTKCNDVPTTGQGERSLAHMFSNQKKKQMVGRHTVLDYPLRVPYALNRPSCTPQNSHGPKQMVLTRYLEPQESQISYCSASHIDRVAKAHSGVGILAQLSP
jgi:hypothetical protein